MQTHIVLQNLNLLFIDDETHITKDAYSVFSSIFKSVTLAHDASSAMHYFDNSKIDIIITDIQLPGEDGLTFIDKIRKINYDIPIIVLSAFSDKSYLLRAANLRVDAYLIKPLSFKKINPVFKRISQRLEHNFSIIYITDNINYSFLTYSLIIDDNLISLGQKERLLLELFLYNTNRVLTKKNITDSIWPHTDTTESALKNLLSELRKKLKYDIIKNIPSQGWILTVDSTKS